MLCVSPEGRITPGCPCIGPDQEAAWKRLTDFARADTEANLCAQIGHAGRKGSTRLAWDGIDLPYEQGNWPLLSASALPLQAGNAVPRAMDRADMDRVRDQLVQAVRSADAAGFDMIEVHAAHGYLLASVISPVTNQRTHAFGGSLDNRMRYPLEVFAAMRAAWPADKPMTVRISVHDWMGDEGVHPDEAVDVSSGQTSKQEKPVYGRMTPGRTKLIASTHRIVAAP